MFEAKSIHPSFPEPKPIASIGFDILLDLRRIVVHEQRDDKST